MSHPDRILLGGDGEFIAVRELEPGEYLVVVGREQADDDVIVRYESEAIIGFTVLHASKRVKQTA